MSRRDSLRGPDAFQRVFRTGKKLDGRFMSCHFLLEPSDDGSLRVGFAVPSKVFKAVRRNRLKRLMREAFRTHRNSLQVALQKARTSISLIFVFKRRSQDEVSRLRLHPLLDDMADLSRRLVARLG